jgi:hypothetical protein
MEIWEENNSNHELGKETAATASAKSHTNLVEEI